MTIQEQAIRKQIEQIQTEINETKDGKLYRNIDCLNVPQESYKEIIKYSKETYLRLCIGSISELEFEI